MGLRGTSVPAQVIDIAKPVSVTCLASWNGEDSYVRAVFVEFADEDGTVAIQLAPTVLHSETTDADWKTYLQETFADVVFDYQDSNGALVAIARSHPRSPHVKTAYASGSPTVDLWDAASRDVSALIHDSHDPSHEG